MITCGVIIPFADRTEFLHEALESVYNQTVIPDEVLVIGNVPLPENCRHFYENESFYFMQTERQGLVDKVNYVAKLLTTEAMYILCDDDKLQPDFTEKVLKAMEENEVDIVYTDKEMFGLDPRVVEAAEWTAPSFYESTVPFITALISMYMWEIVGGYDSFPFCDWDLWWRCFDEGAKAFHIHEPLFLYRTSEQQGSRSPEQAPFVEQNRAIVRGRHFDRVTM